MKQNDTMKQQNATKKQHKDTTNQHNTDTRAGVFLTQILQFV